MTQTLQELGTLDGLSVLVVDDEADIRLGLRKLIRTLGADVTVAADGREALDLVEQEGPDVVLTDLMMPRMSGSELLLSAVKERWPSTVVVVLTGFGTIQNAVSCLQMRRRPLHDQALRQCRRCSRLVDATRATGDLRAGSTADAGGQDRPTIDRRRIRPCGA